MLNRIVSPHLNNLSQAAAASAYKGGQLQQDAEQASDEKSRSMRFIIRKAQQEQEDLNRPNASSEGHWA